MPNRMHLSSCITHREMVQGSEMRIPSVIDTGKTVESCIESLWCNYRQHIEAKPHALPLHDSASRYACGYPVPSFQRHLVWTLAQKVAFVESLWLGIYPGTYCIHESDWSRDGTPVPFSGWLIDGQQRLTTIEQYWNCCLKQKLNSSVPEKLSARRVKA